MTIGEAYAKLIGELNTIYDEREAANIADWVFENVTDLKKVDRILNKHKLLDSAHESQLTNYKMQLLQNKPVQYVLNEAGFAGLTLYVDEGVLIPRPETEELVDWIIKDVNASGKDVFKKAPTDADVTEQLKILDIGTGSGCIALALKNVMPKAEVWGCDVSEEALNVARRNGSDLNIRVDFQGIDFLDDAQQKFLPTVDIIVSNPPYIPLKEKEEMHPNVVNHEPHTALFVPDNDALVFYKAIAHFAKKRLYENGSIYLEFHENLGGEIVTLFEQEGYTTIELRKDMQGKNRMIKVVNGE